MIVFVSQILRKSITDIDIYINKLADVINSLKFIEEEENLVKKMASPKKPKTAEEKEKEKERQKEREARKKAYMERKAQQIEQNRKKAEEDRM